MEHYNPGLTGKSKKCLRSERLEYEFWYHHLTSYVITEKLGNFSEPQCLKGQIHTLENWCKC